MSFGVNAIWIFFLSINWRIHSNLYVAKIGKKLRALSWEEKKMKKRVVHILFYIPRKTAKKSFRFWSANVVTNILITDKAFKHKTLKNVAECKLCLVRTCSERYINKQRYTCSQPDCHSHISLTRSFMLSFMPAMHVHTFIAFRWSSTFCRARNSGERWAAFFVTHTKKNKTSRKNWNRDQKKRKGDKRAKNN